MLDLPADTDVVFASMQFPDSLHTEVQNNVRAALAEDLGSGDLTARLSPAGRRSRGTVITREAAVIAGKAWFDACFQQLDNTARIRWHVADGETVRPDQALCEIEADTRVLLSAERAALNFLQLLSATATVTRRYVDAVAGTRATIVDTRKTLPGLRRAQKYAVLCGGGSNHRLGLYDGILIKENHIIAAAVTMQHQSPSVGAVDRGGNALVRTQVRLRYSWAVKNITP